MKLQVQSIHFNADRKLIEYIQQRIEKLQTFYNRVVRGDVYLKLNNEGVENKTVEIELHVRGRNLFAKEQAKSFETAVDNATEALLTQLRKFKTKIKAGRA